MAIQKLLTARGVSEILNLKEQTVRRKASEGIIPSHKVGKSYRFKESDIQDYLEKSRCDVQPPYDERLTDFALNLCKQKKESLVMRKSRLPQRLNLGYGGYYLRRYPPSKHNRAGMERWYIYFYDEHGKKHEKVIKLAASPEDAFEALVFENRKAFNRYLGRETEEDSKKDATFKDYSKVYFENYVEVKKAKPETDRSIINGLIPFFGCMRMSEVDKFHVDSYIKKIKDRGLKASTINLHLNVLKRMFNKAIEWSYSIKENPVSGDRLIKEKDDGRQRVISEKEYNLILDKAEGHLRPILICLWNTGMRKSEVLSLQWGAVDLNPKTRSLTVKAEFSKSGKERKIPVNDDLHDALRQLSEQRDGCQNVFTYLNRPIRTVESSFKSAIKKAGIKRRITLHDFRHTAGTRMMAKGVDAKSVRDTLGHSDLRETEKYLHSVPENLRRAVKVLESNDKKVRRI